MKPVISIPMKTSRGSCNTNRDLDEGRDKVGNEPEHINKIQNFITENNMKKLEKFKTIYQSSGRNNSGNRNQSVSQQRKKEVSPSAINRQGGNQNKMFTTRDAFASYENQQDQQSSHNKRLFDKHKRVLDQFSSRGSLKQTQITCLKKGGQSDFDQFELMSPEQFKTIDTVTIENSKNQQFEVTINVPTNSNIIGKLNFQNYNGQLNSFGSSTQRQQKKFVQNKPPKPSGDKGGHQRQNTNFSTSNTHLETQSIISDTLSQNNMSRISCSTQLKPFNLSRSNSRRTKDVLIQEKTHKQKQEEEELQKMKQSIIAKPKQIPYNHYVPDMMVFRSTKSLTSFQEFNFGSTSSRKSSTHAVQNNSNSNQGISECNSIYQTIQNDQNENSKKSNYSILFKTQRSEVTKNQSISDSTKQRPEPIHKKSIREVFERYNEDKENSEGVGNYMGGIGYVGSEGISILEHIIRNNKLE